MTLSLLRIFFPILVEFLKNLIILYTQNIRFEFEGNAYKQVNGVAMGRPLEPLLAAVFLVMIERKVHENIAKAFPYKRYVDDILIFTDNDYFNTFLQLLNSTHPNLSVSHEKETNDCFNFLDIKMKKRRDGTSQRSVYRKATCSGQYLQFFSFASMAYKRELVKTLYHRTRTICSSDTLRKEEQFLKVTLMHNGHPEKFIALHFKNEPKPDSNYEVPRKLIYLNLAF